MAPRITKAPTQKLIALRPSSYVCACSKQEFGFKDKEVSWPQGNQFLGGDL